MKTLLLFIVAVPFCLLPGTDFAQQPDFRHMTPEQIMHYADSVKKANLQLLQKNLPNGSTLNRPNVTKADTSFTSVSFEYHEETTGKDYSAKADIICHASNVPVLHLGGNINVNLSASATSTGTSGYSLYATSTGFHNAALFKKETGSGDGGFGFSLTYDPISKIAGVVAGANMKKTSTTNAPYGDKEVSTTGDMSIGVQARTNPAQTIMPGVSNIQGGHNEDYCTVEKTSYGYRIVYNSKTQTGDEPYVRTTIKSLTAFVGLEPDYEAVIVPADAEYPKWLPKGPAITGVDDSKGDSIFFKVEVHSKKDPAKPYNGAYTVHWSLKNITHYPGFCSNYPLYTEQPDIKGDVKFPETLKASGAFETASFNDSTANTLTGKGNTVLKLYCMDYAAWAQLTAAVTIEENGVSIDATAWYNKNNTHITIPYDEDENKIADLWEKDNNIFGKKYTPDWDEDNTPDNGHNGDNISLLDEYRGFLLQEEGNKVFKRLSPRQKDVFTIAQSDAYKNEVTMGAKNYEKITQLSVHHFTAYRYGVMEPGSKASFGRWINYNSPVDHKTFGIAILVSDAIKPGKDKSTGWTAPLGAEGTGDYLPEDVNFINVQPKAIAGAGVLGNMYLGLHPFCSREEHNCFSSAMMNHMYHANLYFGYHIDTNNIGTTVKEQIALLTSRLVCFTVTHELGHATHIHHHHVADAGTDDVYSYKGDSHCPLRYWLYYNNEKNPVWCADHNDWFVSFLSTIWDPTSMLTPDTKPFTLCKDGDDCFHQMKLKNE